MTFRNMCDHLSPEEADDIPAAELKAAGIKVEKLDWVLNKNSEVRTRIVGSLHGWIFKRAWYYWICNGPGIELGCATALHEKFGKTVRVDGDCSCPSPLKRFKGFACGHYHVDDAEGLKALADVIRLITERAEDKMQQENL